MKKPLIPYIAAVILVLALLAVRASSQEKRVSRTEFLMDTIVESRIFTRNTKQGEEALALAYQEMSRLEELLDRHRADSEVNLINASAGKREISVSDHTTDVIARALQISERTGGAFDITVAPLLRLWGFGTAEEKVPLAAEIEAARQKVGFRRVLAEQEGNTVFLKDEGMELDLGGIAKGYIVDMAADIMIRQGVFSAYLDAGGDIRVIGTKPDGSPWRIGIRHPRDRRKVIAALNLSDRAIVTSGDYERFFTVDGVRYHHIIDPGTGMPARGLISVTVIGPDAFTADAYSTAFFVLGLEKGMALVEQDDNLEAIMITEDEQIHLSSGLLGKVEVLP